VRRRGSKGGTYLYTNKPEKESLWKLLKWRNRAFGGSDEACLPLKGRGGTGELVSSIGKEHFSADVKEMKVLDKTDEIPFQEVSARTRSAKVLGNLVLYRKNKEGADLTFGWG